MPDRELSHRPLSGVHEQSTIGRRPARVKCRSQQAPLSLCGTIGICNGCSAKDSAVNMSFSAFWRIVCYLPKYCARQMASAHADWWDLEAGNTLLIYAWPNLACIIGEPMGGGKDGRTGHMGFSRRHTYRCVGRRLVSSKRFCIFCLGISCVLSLVRSKAFALTRQYSLLCSPPAFMLSMQPVYRASMYV